MTPLAAIPKVDVVPDAFDWANLIIGILGVAGTIAAIYFAVQAQRDATKARKAVTKERRRQFELEILRDLMEDIDERHIDADAVTHPTSLHRYQHRVNLLPADALPFWLLVMTTTTQDELRDATGYRESLAAAQKRASEADAVARSASAGVLKDTPEVREKLQAAQKAQQDLFGEFERHVRGELVGNVQKAIAQRVDAIDD